jgi:type II secretory pathway pseudopilin PulG
MPTSAALREHGVHSLGFFMLPHQHIANLRRTRPRRAFSLVEMILATALVAGTLAPALAVMRNAMATSRETTKRLLLANYAVEVLEYAQGISMQTWFSGTVPGNLASDGYANIRYTITWSDAPASGGVTGKLMHVQVVVFDDANGNSALDSTELAVRYRTKVAKLTTYTSLAN